ncbi:MAG: tetratricopeptide repeat protein [Chloroflexota bacterium]|nr:MAG: tetratricopeptide repeat protein [Chloroflexota bacterium]
MSDNDFERYKAALKAGHVALLRERLPEALEHYIAASEIAPDRPLPYASQGQVLFRLGRTADALTAYARALGRAPRDEASLAGRAEALLAAGRKREASEVLERLAEVQVETDRLPEGLTTMRRALELHQTKRRRTRVQALADLADKEPVAGPRGEARPTVSTEPVAASDVAAGPGPTERPAASEAAAVKGPQAPTEPVGASETTLVDPTELEQRAELAVAYGRTSDAVAAYLAAAEARAARGEPQAALEACQLALGLAPADPSVHLVLARRYLDRGWRELAGRKLALLRSLAELDPSALTPPGRASLEALLVEAGQAQPPRPAPPA